jgi:enoyl-CoA hydratase/carnithine racemase
VRPGPTAAVTVEESAGVAVVRVGYGTRRNALTTYGWDTLREASTRLTSRTDLTAVVLRGAGDTFCAGSDLTEWDGADGATVDASFAAMEAALQAVEAIPVPTLAVVQGAATGAGCQLALACDLQVLARSARVGMPVAQLGILLSPAFATRLTLQVGPARTKELLYSGRILGADDAASIGLISRVVDDTDLQVEVDALLALWASHPGSALRAAKAAVDAGLQPLHHAAHHHPPTPSSDRTEMPHRIRRFLLHTRHRRTA